MALNLDPKLAQEAAESVVGVMNGSAQECIVEAWQIAQQAGEGNPVVDGLRQPIKDYEGFYNEQFAPAANRLKENMEAFGEFATFINNAALGKVAAAEDIGHIDGNEYDVAHDL